MEIHALGIPGIHVRGIIHVVVGSSQSEVVIYLENGLT